MSVADYPKHETNNFVEFVLPCVMWLESDAHVRRAENEWHKKDNGAVTRRPKKPIDAWIRDRRMRRADVIKPNKLLSLSCWAPCDNCLAELSAKESTRKKYQVGLTILTPKRLSKFSRGPHCRLCLLRRSGSPSYGSSMSWQDVNVVVPIQHFPT